MKEESKKTNVKILVACHKPVKLPKSDILMPIHVGRSIAQEAAKDGTINKIDALWMTDNMIGDNTGDNISVKNRTFNELTAVYWAWKNLNADYIGLCHYRRYFSFSNKKYPTHLAESNAGCVEFDYLTDGIASELNLTNDDVMIAQIEQCDAVVSTPINLRDFNIKNNYEAMRRSPDYHFIEDTDLMLKIINDKYPNMMKTAEQYMFKTDKEWLYNCFVMKAEIFRKYAEFLFGVLFEIEKSRNLENYSMQQSRLMGLIGERLTAIYFTYLKSINSNVLGKQLVFFKNTELTELAPAFQKNNVAIASNFNNNYVHVFTVFLISAIEHFSPNYNYDIILLSMDISEQSKSAIKEVIAGHDNISIRYINPLYILPEDPLPKYDDNCYPVDLFVRCYIPYILKGFDKVLVVDADMIANADLAELYLVDIKGFLAAGVRDVICQAFQLGKRKHEGWREYYEKRSLSLRDYINTGVILMNTDEIRKRYSMEYTTMFIKGTKFRVWEQDALNFMYSKNIKYLDAEWNVFTYTNQSIAEGIKSATHQDAFAYIKARDNPKIIHYADRPKPWDSVTGDYVSCFWKYARQTPFYEQMIMKLVPTKITILKRKIIKYANFLFRRGTLLGKIVRKIYYFLRWRLKV